MSQTETRVKATTVKVETREDGKPKRLFGHGAVYYKDGKPDTEYVLWEDDNEKVVERIREGAFDPAQPQKSFFNHDPNLVLGSTAAGTMRVSVDADGLAYDVDIPDTQAGRDIAVSIERGDVTGSSFMFRDLTPKDERFNDLGEGMFVRNITKVEVYEQGPVTFPAYEGTDTNVRNKSNIGQVRADFQAWKETRDDKPDVKPDIETVEPEATDEPDETQAAIDARVEEVKRAEADARVNEVTT